MIFNNFDQSTVQVKRTPQETPLLDVKFSEGDFITVQCREKNIGDEGKTTEGDNDDSTSELFPCPRDGCIRSYKRHSNLEHHLLYGKCKLRQERYTLLDQAKLLYTMKINEGTSTQPQMASTSSATVEGNQTVCQGWALRATKRSSRFNENQKSYLDERFDLGAKSGHKADPAEVARDLRHARNENGGRRFTIDEFLTPQQVKSYFSRKAAKQRKTQASSEETDRSAEDQTAYCATRDKMLSECQLIHPIIYDTYDLCSLHAEKKLTKFSVSFLRQICIFYDMVVEGLPARKKVPYVTLIGSLVQTCSCYEG